MGGEVGVGSGHGKGGGEEQVRCWGFFEGQG